MRFFWNCVYGGRQRVLITFFGLVTLLSCCSGQLAAATISSISPPIGHAGDVVQLNGSGFDTNSSNDVVRFGPNRAPVLAATSTQLTVQVPNGQPLGPTTVSLNGANGPRFTTVTNTKIASIPPNPAAACSGCTCGTCSCGDKQSSLCVSKPANLGGSNGSGSGNIYGERGEFFQNVTDLAIPGRPGAADSLQFKIQRFYRSAATNSGALGRNWDHSYLERLEVEPDGSIMDHNGLGRNDRYLLNNHGSYVAPAEFYTTLVKNPDGSYTLTYRDRTVKEFDSSGKIQRIQDRNANVLAFSYDAQNRLQTVTDTFGRAITYTYDGSNRIHEITDFVGRTVTYNYSGNGDLVSVTTPAVTGTPNGNDFPSGKTTTYSYDSNHRMLTVTRPNESTSSGPPVIQNTYDSSGRVMKQSYGGTNASGSSAGGTYTYTYSQLNSGVTSDDPNLPVMRTQQTDRNGNVTQYDYNTLGYPLVVREMTHGIRPTDPSSFVTTMTYNADGRLIQTTLPQGNSIQYQYDDGNADRYQEGNLLSETRIPDSRGGDQTSIVTTYTYEPNFNHIATMTEPRGNDPTFVPQNGGGNTPGRYTTHYSYDVNGNLLEKQSPTVRLPNGTSQSILNDYTYNSFGQTTSETDPEGNVTIYQYCPTATPNCTAPDSGGGGYLFSTTIDATTSPRRTEATTPAQITHQFFYDMVGNMTRSVDGRGNDKLLIYNQLNQVVETQSEAPFRYTTFNYYDANDNVVRQDTANRVVTEGTDGKPVFSSDGNFSTQDGSPAFFTNRVTYDILDRPVKQDLDAAGSTPPRIVTQYQYDANENQIQLTQPIGNVIRMQYDERNLLFTTTRGFGDPAASTTRSDYDLNRNLADTVDGRGLTTLYRYDGFDRRVQITDAVGGQTASHYDPAGNVVSTSKSGQPGGPSPTNNSGAGNVLLRQRTAEYDELDRRFQYDDHPVNGSSFVPSGVTTVRPPSVTTGPLNPGAISEQFVYDRNSRLVQHIEDDLATTATQYDGVNRRVLETDPVSNTVEMHYDANNNVIMTRETDISQVPGVSSETITTTRQYDSRNRMTSMSDNCMNTRRSAYDSRNNLTDQTDAKSDNVVGCSGSVNPQGNSVQYVYDGLSRRIESIEALRVGGVGSGAIDTSNSFNSSGMIKTTMTYDGNSNSLSFTDGRGNTTQSTYDALNRRTAEILPDGTRTSYVFDADDNVTKLTDNNGTVQNHTYDALNRRIQTTVTPAAGVIGTTSNTYQYDGLSRMTLLTDNNDSSDPSSASTAAFAYDTLNRIVEEMQNGKPVDNAWNAQARRTSLIYPNGRQLDYTYDALQRVQTIKDDGASSNLAQYSYIGAERVLQRLYQNGTVLTYLDDAGAADVGYDALRRPIQRRDLHSAGKSLIVGFTYSYDREGNKIDEGKLHSAATSELYTYDSVYRITDFARGQLSASNPPTVPAPSATQDWGLDAVGNWRVQLLNGVSQTRSVTNTNEYSQIVTGGGSPTTDNLSYDANGNLLLSTNLETAYQWDYRNRLRKVCQLAGSATGCNDAGATVIAVYSYDGLNRRTRKVVTNSGSLNGITSFYYDDWRTIEERDVSETVTQQYVYGIYLDEPLILDRTSAPRLFYHQNELYSTFALTDPTGAVVEGYQYDPYGKPTVLGPDFSTVVGTSSAVGNPYLFTGQRLDPETGLFYYKNRYYSSSLGRFLSRDARGYAEGPNLYEYVADDPTNMVDPTGEASFRLSVFKTTLIVHLSDATKIQQFGDFTTNDFGKLRCYEDLYRKKLVEGVGEIGKIVAITPLTTAAGLGVFGEEAKAAVKAIGAIKKASDILEKIKDALKNVEVTSASSRNFDKEKCGCDVYIFWNKTTNKVVAHFEGKTGVKDTGKEERTGLNFICCDEPLRAFSFAVTGTVKIKKGWFGSTKQELEDLADAPVEENK